MKITVYGAGGWGCALAMVLARNRHQVTLWTHTAAHCEALRRTRENEKLLPGVKLPEEIDVCDQIACGAAADLIVMAVPSFAVAETAARIAAILPAGVPVVNVGKGLDAANGFCRLSESIDRAMGGRNPVVALTGPTHAEEVARGIPTAILAASHDHAAAELCQDVFMNEYFRVYTSDDLIGAELGGAFKNIIALAAGISDGLELGDNSKAALMTRGLTEIARLGIALGARQDTFAGLSGVGDLIVTCTSMHSRNRRAGILIGQGMTAQQAMEQVGAVVEGYYATNAGYQLARRTGISMPIVEQLYGVLYENADAVTAIRTLMTRSKKDEHESETIWVTQA